MTEVEEEDFARLSLQDRLVHKSWKARVSAYEEVEKSFRLLESSLEFKKHHEVLRKCASDANAAALDSGLSAILAFVTNSPTQTRQLLLSTILDKSLASSRTSTKSKTLDIVLMYIETDNPESVIQDILPLLSHKSPKYTTAALSILVECVRIFGTRIIPAKPLLKSLASIFDHKDKNVRLMGSQLAVEMYKYLGPAAINQFLNDLKPVQVKELNVEFEKLGPVKGIPSRLVRSEQLNAESPAVNSAPAAQNPEGILNCLSYAAIDVDMVEAAAPEEEKADPFELVDPIDLLEKLPKNFYEELASSKWKERKEALEALVCFVNAPKIAEGRYGELLSVLGKVGTLSDSMVEDMLGSFTHKNPQVRMEGLQWCVRAIKIALKAPGKSELKALTESMIKGCDDGDNNVRTAACEGLGTLLHLVNGKGLVAIACEKLEPLKLAKVREFSEAAGTLRPISKAALKVPISASNQTISNHAEQQEKENTAPKGVKVNVGSSKSTLNSKPKNTKAKAASTTAKESSSTPDISKPNFDLVLKFTDVSSEAIIEEVVGTFTEDGESYKFSDVTSSSWKTRLCIIKKMSELLQLSEVPVEPEMVFRTLMIKPGWKENNFQVLNAMIDVFTSMLKSSGCTPGAASLIIPGLTDKLGDMKIKKNAAECLSLLAEASSFGFVLSQVYEPIKKQKSPKVIGDSLAWIQSTLLEFGVTGVSARELIEFAKICCGNTNQAVRNNSVALLTTLGKYVPAASIRALVSDLNPTLLSAIELGLADTEGAPEPAKRSIMLAPSNPAVKKIASTSHASLAATESEEIINNEDVIDDLVPRTDISQLITNEIIEDLNNVAGHTSWKLRKQGLEQVLLLLENANRKIKPNLGNELIAALKGRLSDTNRNLAAQALELCGILASSVGRSFERHAKILCGPVTSCLSDNKANVRLAAISALDAFVEASGFGSLVASIGPALMADNSVLRKDLMKWVSEKLGSSDGSARFDLSPLTHSTLLCLQDRNSDVRKFATIVLNSLVQTLSFEVVMDKAGDLFIGSQLSSIIPFVEAARANTAKITPATSVTNLRATPSLAKPKTPTRSRVASAASDEFSKPKVKAPVRSSSTTRKTEAEPLMESASVPLLTSDIKLKDTRASQDRGLNKWTFEVPRKELVEFLHEQCHSNFNPDTVAAMFSVDHYKERDFLTALTSLIDGIDETKAVETFGSVEAMQSRYVCNSDLILKYITLRFFDTNTSMLIKCLDLLESLFNLLDSTGSRLSEYEASCFLPFFVNKTGDNKETMRVKCREIMKQICRIYPASKLFSYVIRGLESKNARTRVECLEELAILIQRNGMSVCASPSKMFPIIAAQIADRDATVRNGAMNAITQSYLLVGDQVFKYVGRLSDKDKSLLEEKFKRLPTNPAPIAAKLELTQSSSSLKGPVHTIEAVTIESETELTPIMAETDSPAKKGVKNEFTLDFDENNFPKTPRRQVAQIVDDGIEDVVMESALSVEISNDTETAMMDFIINQITASDSNMSINALKHLEKTLSTAPQSLAPYMDDIVSAITVQIRLSFIAADIGDQSIARLCKHLVNMLVQLFTNTELPQSLLRGPLFQCIKELLNRLLDPKLSKIENGIQLTKALNVLMVRILENCDRNATFGVLLEILQTSSQIIGKCSDDQMSYQSKYIELVMKCLWKMTKIIPKLIEDDVLHVNQLILEVHKFLVATPPSEWKRRAAEKRIPQADMPLRTIKTILHELSGALDVKVFNCIELIPDIHSSHAVLYLKQMVENRRRKLGLHSPIALPAPKVDFHPSAAGGMIGVHTGSPTTRLPHPFGSMGSPPSNTNDVVKGDALDNNELRSELTMIFEKIRDKDRTKDGISELFGFKKKYSAAVDDLVEEFVNSTGAYFQGYIRRGLQVHEDSPQTRRPVSMIASPTFKSPAVTGGSHQSSNNSYKERLERIQQKFRGTSSKEDLNADASSVPISSGSNSRPLSVDSLMSPFATAGIPKSSEVRANQIETQSYEALKERLNRMKLNMNQPK